MNVPRHWKPLKRISNTDFKPAPPELVAIVAKQYRLTEEAAVKWLDEDQRRYEFFTNDIYQVQVSPTGVNADYLHLNIRRRDGGMVKDWRHFQQIKNEIAGPEREAVEIYPAESRLVHTSNKWHLWVLPEGEKVNLGWIERDIQYEELRGVPGLRQRPL
jgi:hypothetical protein